MKFFVAVAVCWFMFAVATVQAQSTGSVEAVPVVEQQAEMTDEAKGQLVDAVNFEEEVVYFLFDNAELTDAAKVELKKVAERMREYPEVRILVEGNASYEGAPVYNLDLSLKRARAVIDFLVTECHIDRDRLVASHLGNLNPSSRKDPKSSAEVDRRVRFHILGGWFLVLRPPSPPPPVIQEGDQNLFYFDFRKTENFFSSPILGLGGDAFHFEDKPITDRKWTIGQRVLLSSLVGLATGTLSGGGVYLADVRADVERTDGVGGHWEVYRNVGLEEGLGFAGGFAGGFGATFIVSGTFYWTPDRGFKIKFGN